MNNEPLYCSNCGAERRHSNARFCHKCGHATPPVATPPTEPQPVSKRSRLPFLIGAILAILVISAVVVTLGPGSTEIQLWLATAMGRGETPEITPTSPSATPTSISLTPTPTDTAPPTATDPPTPTDTLEPTDTPVLTATPKPTKTPTSTNTPILAVTPDVTPTSISPEPTNHFTLAIRHLTNSNTTDGYSNPPLGRLELGGIPFDLGEGNSVTTQAYPLPNNPTHLVIPADIPNPQIVYLLTTGGNLYERFNGRKLGEIRLNFSGGDRHTIDLIAGDNIREWKHYDDKVVSRITSPSVTEVWRGGNNFDSGETIFDMLRIDVPETMRSQTLVSVEILDQTQQIVREMDPAINLNGVTVSAMQTATPTPVPTPTSVACSIQPQGRFAAIWRDHRLILGCPTNAAMETGGATQKFQRGQMIWREIIDWHYVLHGDGRWQDYADEHEDGMVEPGGYHPPLGLVTPLRGFGIVWQKYQGGPNSQLGWGLADEYWMPFLVQDFEKGLLIELEGKIYLLGNTGAQWFNP